MGALGTRPDRTTALTQPVPLPIPVDDDATLVEDTVEKERRSFLDSCEVGDVDMPTRDTRQIGSQGIPGREMLSGDRDQQVQVRARVLVTASQRAVDHGEAHVAASSQSPPKIREKPPVGQQVLALAGCQPQPPRPSSTGTQSPLGCRPSERALLGTEIPRQLLNRSHNEAL